MSLAPFSLFAYPPMQGCTLGAVPSSFQRWDITTRSVLEQHVIDPLRRWAAPSIATSQTGTLVLTSYIDTLHAWNSGDIIWQHHDPQARWIRVSEDMSPQGNHFVSVGHPGRAESGILWDASTFERLGAFPKVSTAAFDPTGTILALGTNDKEVILWDIHARRAIGEPFTAHQDTVTRLAFSPDGHSLVSGSQDGGLYLWDTRVDAWLERACTRAGRNFTPDEWQRLLGEVPYQETCPEHPAPEPITSR